MGKQYFWAVDVIPRFGRYVKLSSQAAALPGGLVEGVLLVVIKDQANN